MKAYFTIDGIDTLIADLDEKTFESAFKTTTHEIVQSSMIEAFKEVKKKFRIYTKKVKPYKWNIYSKKASTRAKGGMSVIRNKNSTDVYIYGYPMQLSNYDTSRGSTAYTRTTLKRKKRTNKDIRVKILKNKVTRLVSNRKDTAYFRGISDGEQKIYRRVDKKIKQKNTITPTSMFMQVDYIGIFEKQWKAKSYNRFVHNLSRKRGGFIFG